MAGLRLAATALGTILDDLTDFLPLRAQARLDRPVKTGSILDP
jgi:hypothetical protein